MSQIFHFTNFVYNNLSIIAEALCDVFVSMIDLVSLFHSKPGRSEYRLLANVVFKI